MTIPMPPDVGAGLPSTGTTERAPVPPRRGSKNGPSPDEPESQAIEVGVSPRGADEPYTVVARRYRPQRFEEVVGQDHVVRSLRNAIRLNRIAQAYLFCGTRGVGKTTMARIFAKCLNCAKGPTAEPCQVCDVCQAIASGQDVDVIEIDGASNNGVEQVRELRQNAGLRPSRSRFKVYYIDEVHMLSTGAFNALLKTLEEPPPHVKFIFATTEANKIPDTVLSRCQRYDLAGITPQLIARTLGEICEHEKVPADPEALHVVARRAAGSLRDAESLLDRLLAAGPPRLTVEAVQDLLGTASDDRLLAILEALADHDPAEALRLLDEATDRGVQPSEVLGGLLDFLRDAMVLALGADSILLAVTPRQKPRLQALIERFPVDAILAALQVVDQHRSRLRGSLHGRLLVEMALVRIARLDDLEQLESLIDRLGALETVGPVPRRPDPATAKNSGRSVESSGTAKRPPSGLAPNALMADLGKKKRPEGDGDAIGLVGNGRGVAPVAGPETGGRTPAQEPSSTRPLPVESMELDLHMARQLWTRALAETPKRFQWRLLQVEPVAVLDGNILAVAPKPENTGLDETVFSAEMLGALGTAFRGLVNRPIQVRFEPSNPSAGTSKTEPDRDPARVEPASSDPFVQKVVEVFDARQIQVDYEGRDAGASA